MARRYPHLDVRSDLGGAFSWSSKYVDVGDGVRQAYIDEGPRDAPLTFLLLHGNPTWSFLYRKFIPPLAADHRVIAIDHVGFGRSDKPRDPDYYTLERHIANLGTTLEHLKVRNVVPVMQDWAGPIGMGWATRNPDRVAGVVVLNTWAFVRDPPTKLPLVYRFLFQGRAGWNRLVRKNFLVETVMGGTRTNRKLAPAELDAYRAPFPLPEDRVGMARMPQLVPEAHTPDHESFGTMAAIEDALPLLRDKPALIVWARGDVVLRKAPLERWTRVFSQIDGPHLLRDARHFLQEDAPDEIVAHMQRWAAGVGARVAPKRARASAATVRRARA